MHKQDFTCKEAAGSDVVMDVPSVFIVLASGLQFLPLLLCTMTSLPGALLFHSLLLSTFFVFGCRQEHLTTCKELLL